MEPGQTDKPRGKFKHKNEYSRSQKQAQNAGTNIHHYKITGCPRIKKEAKKSIFFFVAFVIIGLFNSFKNNFSVIDFVGQVRFQQGAQLQIVNRAAFHCL